MSRQTRVALLPIGYGDGYRRSLSNKTGVYIRGHYAPVIGLISMNLIIVDITDFPDVQEDDIVHVMDDLPGIRAVDLAKKAEISVVEWLTGLSPAMPRITKKVQDKNVYT